MVRWLLTRDVDLEAVDPDGCTALAWAAKRGAAKHVGAETRNEARRFLNTKILMTSLGLVSVQVGYVVLSGLVPSDCPAKIKRIDPASGRTEMAEALLEHGAWVNSKDKHGYTPLVWAAKTGAGETPMAYLKCSSCVSWTPCWAGGPEGHPNSCLRSFFQQIDGCQHLCSCDSGFGRRSVLEMAERWVAAA